MMGLVMEKKKNFYFLNKIFRKKEKVFPQIVVAVGGVE